jgi:hypothetical protein
MENGVGNSLKPDLAGEAGLLPPNLLLSAFV